MRSLERWATVAFALTVGTAGCSLPRGTIVPVSPMDGGPDHDANVLPTDAERLPDTFIPPDGFIFPDAFTPDVGLDASCTPGRTCHGTEVIECAGGVESIIVDCAATSEACEGGVCVTLCPSGDTRCVDGRSEQCDASGHWGMVMTCPVGCDGDSCATPMGCTTRTAAGMVVVGGGTTTLDFDLCSRPPATDFNGGRGGRDCDDANGNEVMLTLDVATEGMVTLDLRDADGDTLIDTMLYVRPTCDDSGSEIACDDDEPCDPSDGIGDCAGAVQWGHSRISRVFMPGRYFVYLDTFSSTDCGMVHFVATSP